MNRLSRTTTRCLAQYVLRVLDIVTVPTYFPPREDSVSKTLDFLQVREDDPDTTDIFKTIQRGFAVWGPHRALQLPNDSWGSLEALGDNRLHADGPHH